MHLHHSYSHIISYHIISRERFVDHQSLLVLRWRLRNISSSLHILACIRCSTSSSGTSGSKSANATLLVTSPSTPIITAWVDGVVSPQQLFKNCAQDRRHVLTGGTSSRPGNKGKTCGIPEYSSQMTPTPCLAARRAMTLLLSKTLSSPQANHIGGDPVQSFALVGLTSG